jgi:hypothetical protein
MIVDEWFRNRWACGRSKFSDDLFGCKLGFCLRCVIIRRHEAKNGVAPGDSFSMVFPAYGRAPAPRSALVGDYHKLRNVSHGCRLGKAGSRRLGSESTVPRGARALVVASIAMAASIVAADLAAMGRRPSGGYHGITL